ncbi:MAG: molybdopterin-dependent oxidoreductase [Candidatus Caldarchaeum sp.]
MGSNQSFRDMSVIRSHCDLCLNFCGVIVKTVSNTIVKIEGDPDNPRNYGKICAKGNAAIFNLYSANRVTTPLIRTNPEKGIAIDPQFVPVSWDEALGMVADKLKEIKMNDPRELYFTTFDLANYDIYLSWCLGFGTVPRPFSSGYYCGNNVHNIHEIFEMGVEADPDPDLCKYMLLVGSQYGSAVNYDVMNAAAGIAKKRPGGIKVVAVDPVGTYCAGRAEEWIPIRPGTDSAFLLSLANLLVNEYKIYDIEYLKYKTNAPYLIGDDGKYVRDESGRPMVWDPIDNLPKSFDDTSIKDFVLEGEYNVDNNVGVPAFQLLKKHLTKYDADHVSRITTVPSKTIRRIAQEFGEAANIGGTIRLDGRDIPFRPACCVWYRGLSAHKHSMLNGMAAELLNVLIGAVDVPGGLLASYQVPSTTTDEGLITPSPGTVWVLPAYPPRKVIPPLSIDLFELCPVACYSRPFLIWAMLHPDIYKPPHGIKMLMFIRTNPVKTSIPRALIEKFMNKIPFIVSFSLQVDESTEFADIVFPDLHYLERLAIGLGFSVNLDRSGLAPSVWYGQKPAVKSPFNIPGVGEYVNVGQILLELADRANFLTEVYKALNHVWRLQEPYKLDPNRKYNFQELIDLCLRNMHGQSKGIGWFMNEGLIVKKRKLEDMYPGAFRKGRVHVYYEFMIEAGKDVRNVTNMLGIPWDTSDYQPLPDWKPCPSYNVEQKEHDLYLVNYKVPQQTFSFTDGTNSVLQYLTDIHRDNCVLINKATAEKKSIKDGDVIYIENTGGVRAMAIARLTELVHPEVIACQGSGGRFASHINFGGNRGINFNDMVVFDSEHVDYVTGAVDSCIRVKIYKAQEDRSPSGAEIS